MSEMFCYQCQETAKNTGCTVTGVCGKKPDVARAQDFLIWLTKGLSELAIKARAKGLSVSTDVNHQVTMNLFTTITNANFDRAAIEKRMKDTIDLKKSLLNEMTADERGALSEAALWDGMDYESKSYDIGVLSTEDENIRSLRELTIYGLKGLAAYTKHANVLLAENEEVDIFIQEALTKTMDDSLSVDDLVGLVLETGTYGVKGMALLDGANSGTYGNPEITEVNIGVRGNPAIIISGHDLRDMEMLLEQTQGTGVDVYTHSEMLPANYYPAFKKYDNFVGNYGNAWWKQKRSSPASTVRF